MSCLALFGTESSVAGSTLLAFAKHCRSRSYIEREACRFEYMAALVHRACMLSAGVLRVFPVLMTRAVKGAEGGRARVHYTLFGHAVCRTFYLKVTDSTVDAVVRALARINKLREQPAIFDEGRGVYDREPSPRALDLFAFLRMTKENASPVPASDGSVVKVDGVERPVRVVSGVTLTALLYDQYREWLRARASNNGFFSVGHFSRIWMEYFPELRLSVPGYDYCSKCEEDRREGRLDALALHKSLVAAEKIYFRDILLAARAACARAGFSLKREWTLAAEACRCGARARLA